MRSILLFFRGDISFTYERKKKNHTRKHIIAIVTTTPQHMDKTAPAA